MLSEDNVPVILNLATRQLCSRSVEVGCGLVPLGMTLGQFPNSHPRNFFSQDPILYYFSVSFLIFHVAICKMFSNQNSVSLSCNASQ